MSTIVDTITAIVRRELAQVRVAELGVVTKVYPHKDGGDSDNYGCDVTLKNSGLELPKVPVATGRIGTVAIPNVGDLVLLAFDRGDLHQPIITGRLYNDEDRPPTSTSDEVVFRLPLAEADNRTVQAAVRNHADSSPARELVVELAPTVKIRIVDKAVVATAGQTKMELEQAGAGGGKVVIQAGATSIELDQDGDVTIVAAGSLSIQAGGDISMTAGSKFEVTAGTSFTVTAGSKCELTAGATAKLRAGGAATVQAAVVQVKGTTMFGP